MKEVKTLLLHTIVCFQMPELAFMPKAFLKIKFGGEKLPLSLSEISKGLFQFILILYQPQIKFLGFTRMVINC